jgi:hypothetical protein
MSPRGKLCGLNRTATKIVAVAASVIVLMVGVAPAPAAPIIFTTPITISADTDVALVGNSVYAYDWNGSIGNATVNGVSFTGTNAYGTVSANLSIAGETG